MRRPNAHHRDYLLSVVEGAARQFGEPGVAYFLQADTLRVVKIGCSGRNYARRLQAIQGCCPVDLRTRVLVTGGYMVEQLIHSEFPEWRTRGEWFNVDSSTEFFMDQLAVRYAHWVEAARPAFDRFALERLFIEQNTSEIGFWKVPEFTRPSPPMSEEPR